MPAVGVESLQARPLLCFFANENTNDGEEIGLSTCALHTAACCGRSKQEDWSGGGDGNLSVRPILPPYVCERRPGYAFPRGDLMSTGLSGSERPALVHGVNFSVGRIRA